MTAHARATDPWTSWAAAAGIDCGPSEAAVMWVFSGGYAWPRTGMTLEMIVDAVQSCAPVMHGPSYSDSRIRTATKTLMDRGLLVDTGKTARTKRGKQARLIRPPIKETLF